MIRFIRLKKACTAAICLLLLFSMAGTSLAAEATATFNGSLEFDFSPSGGTGLFREGLQGIMPGGSYAQTIQVENTSAELVEVYLRGEPGKGNDSDILSQVKFSLESNAGVSLVFPMEMNKNWPTGVGTSIYGHTFVHLGTFYPNQSNTYTLTLHVPADLDNTYQNKAGKVNWIFQADIYTLSGGADDDGPRIPLGPGATITINENTIPLSPGTGDHANLLLWGGLFVVFAILLAVLLYKRRKQHAS